MPLMAVKTATILPSAVSGYSSPNPTKHIVMRHHQNVPGMLWNMLGCPVLATMYSMRLASQKHRNLSKLYIKDENITMSRRARAPMVARATRLLTTEVKNTCDHTEWREIRNTRSVRTK